MPRTGLKDVYWLAPEGREMTTEDWGDGLRRTLGMQLGNDAPDGQRFLILLNAAPDPVDFHLATGAERRLDRGLRHARSRAALVRGTPAALTSGGTFRLDARSLVLFQHAPAAART